MRENRQIAQQEFNAFLSERAHEEERLKKAVHAYSQGALSTAQKRGVSIYQVIYDEMKNDRWPVQSSQQVRKILEAMM